jgi:hypothetical protein
MKLITLAGEKEEMSAGTKQFRCLIWSFGQIWRSSNGIADEKTEEVPVEGGNAFAAACRSTLRVRRLQGRPL